MKNTYFVSVGNIGNIEEGNRREAMKTYNEYVRQSKSNYGRADSENVTLLVNGEPEKEFIYYDWKIEVLEQRKSKAEQKVRDIDCVIATYKKLRDCD